MNRAPSTLTPDSLVDRTVGSAYDNLMLLVPHIDALVVLSGSVDGIFTGLVNEAAARTAADQGLNTRLLVVEGSSVLADTNALAEGSNNLYFTNARVRTAISVTGSLAYNSTTGVVSYTQPANVSTFANDAGYLTSFTETDPTVPAHVKAISTTNIANWNAAHGWGNHAVAGYLTSFTETDPVFAASAAAGVTLIKIGNWDTAFGWGNHGSAGYLLSATAASTYQPLSGMSSYLTTAAGAAAYQPLALVLTNTTAAFTTAQETKLAGIATGATANTGTVTSVGGTGTVSGLTLSGSVTGSGSLTLGGTLSLTSGDVTTALGFTPYNATNPSGYITSAALASYQPLDGDLTAIAALAGTAGLIRKTAADTYTLDTAAYLTGITSGDVTTALGFTPYNATNPSGYTSNAGTVTSVGGTGTVNGLTLSGTVTGSGSLTLGGTLSGVTNSQLADTATGTFKGRVTGGAGSPEDLSGTQATSLLDVFTGALKGLTPASGGGTANFLRADGTWATPAGGSSSPSGSATVTITGPPSGNFEWSETVAAVGLVSGSRVYVQLAPPNDALENDPEMLDIAAMSAACLANDTITITLAFMTPTTGPIVFHYGVM